MKNKFKFIFLLLLALSIPASNFSQDFRPVRDGVEYAELTREIDHVQVRMNLLRLDLTKIRLDVGHAMDAAIGVETTSSIAKRRVAFAAINAGFFRLDTSIFAGTADDALQIDYRLLSENRFNRIALFIRGDGVSPFVNIEHFGLRRYLQIGKQQLDITGIDRERGKEDLVEYTPEFHRTTLTTADGVEIVVIKNRIVSIFAGKGNSPIPENGFVLSASGTKSAEILKLIKTGRKIKLLTTANFPDLPGGGASIFAQAEDIIAGVPQLIKNGRIDITWEQEGLKYAFVTTKNPRTAVAKLKDGKFLMITVDGRSEASGGVSLTDLAALLLGFGATDAMNLDGGGSTTMFLDGKVINHPSDNGNERRVGNALLVFPRPVK